MKLRADDPQPCHAAAARRLHRPLDALRIIERHVAQRPASEDGKRGDPPSAVVVSAAHALRPFRVERRTPSSI